MQLKCLFNLKNSLNKGDFCLLLITFANSLDPDQDLQTVGPDLDPTCLTLIVLLNFFFEKVNFEKIKSAYDKKTIIKNYPVFKDLK